MAQLLSLGIMRLSYTLKTIGVVAFCCIAFLVFMTLCALDSPHCTYESSDRGMADFELATKGRDLKFVETRFEEYKRWKGDPNLQLYRTTKRDWLKLGDILPNPRWSYPYMEPSPNPKKDWESDMKLQELRKGQP